MNWIEVMEEMPMYRKTPKRTETGIFFRMGERSTESPTRMATSR